MIAHLLSTYYVPDTVPSTLHEWIHLRLTTILWVGCSYTHFTDKEIEAEKLCPNQSHVADKEWSWGLNPDSLALGSFQAVNPCNTLPGS